MLSALIAENTRMQNSPYSLISTINDTRIPGVLDRKKYSVWLAPTPDGFANDLLQQGLRNGVFTKASVYILLYVFCKDMSIFFCNLSPNTLPLRLIRISRIQSTPHTTYILLSNHAT